MSQFNGKREESTEGPMEIEPLGPGYGYRVRVIVDPYTTLIVGDVDTMEEAVYKLNKAKEGLGLV